MFITLLAVTFAVAATTSFVAARTFNQPVRGILDRIVSEQIGAAWHRYVTFAIYVVGISGGVRIYALEQYIFPRTAPVSDAKGMVEVQPVVLNADRWTLEVYRTVIEALQSIAWMLLVFFLVALIAFVVVRGFELRGARPPAPS